MEHIPLLRLLSVSPCPASSHLSRCSVSLKCLQECKHCLVRSLDWLCTVLSSSASSHDADPDSLRQDVFGRSSGGGCRGFLMVLVILLGTCALSSLIIMVNVGRSSTAARSVGIQVRLFFRSQADATQEHFLFLFCPAPSIYCPSLA